MNLPIHFVVKSIHILNILYMIFNKTTSKLKLKITLLILGSSAFISMGASLIESKGLSDYKQEDKILFVDGTQLIQETKELVAHYYEVPTILVSASYLGQNFDGRYEYSFSVIGGTTGTVKWEIIGGDDQEGVICED